MIVNRSSTSLNAKFYATGDHVMIATLPNGNQVLTANGGSVFFTIPSNLSQVKIIIPGKPIQVGSLGDAFSINKDGSFWRN